MVSRRRARILPNREIAFLGRQDQQVKLHGHRIEKGEIEQVILQHESILQVTVQICQVAGDGNVGQALVAYYVAQGEIDAGLLNERRSTPAGLHGACLLDCVVCR